MSIVEKIKSILQIKPKFPASTLFYEMNKCHITGNHKTAIIVFKKSNWPQKRYSKISRSYSSDSNQFGWSYEAIGRCRFGNCLDGSDKMVRLDKYNWEIEYWYWQ